MAKKKKRTKSKKQSGSETKARRTKKAKQSSQTSSNKETKAKVEQPVEEASVESTEATEKPAPKVSVEDKPSKNKKEVKETNEAAVLLQEAQQHFAAGEYRDARTRLLTMLEGTPSPEEKEQANELLGNMEMDVRTLMVGAVAMITLLLIPTLGYNNFAKALWTLPVLFLLLVVDPRLFRSPSNTVSDEN